MERGHMSFGKPDNNGRSSGKHNGRRGKLLRPPKNMPWVWLQRDLMQSTAWLKQSRNCRLFVDALLLDLMANAGQENGCLKATYDQLNDIGLPRSRVAEAIAEARHLGLVCCMKKGGRYGGTNQPSEYRLTFYAMLSNDGTIHHASNDWKKITPDDVDLWKENKKLKKMVKKHKEEKQFAGPPEWSSPGRQSGLAPTNLKVIK